MKYKNIKRFILTTEEEYIKAEKYKEQLENEGKKVFVNQCGFDIVQIGEVE